MSKPRCNYPIEVFQRPNTTKVIKFHCQAAHRHVGPHWWEFRVGKPSKTGDDQIIKVEESNIINKI